MDAPEISTRTEMICNRCGCFSSSMTCWSCSQYILEEAKQYMRGGSWKLTREQVLQGGTRWVRPPLAGNVPLWAKQETMHGLGGE